MHIATHMLLHADSGPVDSILPALILQTIKTMGFDLATRLLDSHTEAIALVCTGSHRYMQRWL